MERCNGNVQRGHPAALHISRGPHSLAADHLLLVLFDRLVGIFVAITCLPSKLRISLRTALSEWPPDQPAIFFDLEGIRVLAYVQSKLLFRENK